MKTWNAEAIQGMEQRLRAGFINALSGIQPAHVIGTQTESGKTNLAIFNSVMHLGANPALMGILLRPATVERHTYANLKQTGWFTINQVKTSWIAQAHQTSARYTTSEFEACGLHAEYSEHCKAPYVEESDLQIGLKFEQEIVLEINQTILLIGSIQEVRIKNEAAWNTSMLPDLEKMESAGVCGLDSYYALQKLERFAYAKPDQATQALPWE
ncbi:MAG: flavin reductase family protein [Bacteroidia bacterium]|nr:flavin reductase family protein [Bacteroidia bacterium]